MGKAAKYNIIHDLFSDPDEYEERLIITNYDDCCVMVGKDASVLRDRF